MNCPCCGVLGAVCRCTWDMMGLAHQRKRERKAKERSAEEVEQVKRIAQGANP